MSENVIPFPRVKRQWPDWLREQIDKAAAEVDSWPEGKRERIRQYLWPTEDTP